MSEAAPLVVCTFESRRAEEMCSLISRQGCLPLSAPSMREIPIDHNPEAIEIIQGFLTQKYDAIVLLTGVGTEALFDVARSQGLYDQLIDVLARTPIIIRGPKPAAVLSKVGLKYAVRAPEPNTWRELLSAIDDAKFDIGGKRIVVQEYGLPNTRLYAELQNRGAMIIACPVYRWALPENTEPLESAIRQTAEGKVDAVLFTSANQVSSVLTVADRIGILDQFRAATSSHTLVISIGPTCSEALIDNGFHVHAEASPPKMGQLARAAADALKARQNSPPT